MKENYSLFYYNEALKEWMLWGMVTRITAEIISKNSQFFDYLAW